MLTPEQKIAEHPLLLQRIAALEAKLAWLQKQVFGGGKSEKLDVTQRQLELEGVDTARAAVAEKTEPIPLVASSRLNRIWAARTPIGRLRLSPLGGRMGTALMAKAWSEVS